MRKIQSLNEAEGVENNALDTDVMKAEKPTEPTFTVEQLRPDARVLFGISQSTYDGATAAIDRKQTFTVDGMRQHIERWLKEEY